MTTSDPTPAVGRMSTPAGRPGRYRPLYSIGRGGMGRVEVALDRGDAGYERVVALKWLLPEAARDRRQTEMFLREARLAALLDHPNVVHAFDSGELDGDFFLAMEYVAGEPLSQVLRRVREHEGGVPSPLAAYVLAEICEGLHAAHELRDANGNLLRVVHRDVSPHNVMIGFDGQVKLLDFGVAKIGSENGLTKTGEVKGKVAYMSPEQAMGDVLNRTSDLYSVGAVLFECIAGRKMWEGTDMEVLRNLALGEPPSLEDAAPDAPVELCDLYTQLVTRNPTDRPSTARHVAERLRAFAAKSGAAPDSHVLRALMARLFGAEAVERAQALSRALEEAAPRQAEDLHRSVHPGGTLPDFTAGEVTGPGERGGPGDSPWTQRGSADGSPRAESRPARRAWPAIVAIAAIVATATGVVWMQRARATGASAIGAPRPDAIGSVAMPSAPPSDTAARAGTATASPQNGGALAANGGASTSGSSGAPAAAASATNPSSPPSPATSTTPAPRPAGTAAASPRPRTGTPKPKPSAKPVDVDPNPI